MFRKILLMVFSIFAFSSASHADWFGRTQPVYNVNDGHIVTGTGKTPTLDQVEQAFVDAAHIKGWRPARVEPGHYIVSIDVRQHFAQIDVRLTPTSYSITYKDSRVLRYDGTKIHRNYNKWVKLLEEQFLLDVSKL